MAAVDKLNLWGGRGTVRAATMGGGTKPQGCARRQNCRPPTSTAACRHTPRRFHGAQGRRRDGDPAHTCR